MALLNFKSTLTAFALGRRVNMEEWNTITRVLEGATLKFGVPVGRGANSKGCVAYSEGTLSSVGAAVAGNTGAATITASPPVAAGTAPGTYKLTAITTGATAIFELENPDGVSLGEVTTGTPATIGGIGPFTITDAGTDPAIGDQFTIVVSTTAGDFLGISEANVVLVHTTADQFELYDNVPVCEVGVIGVQAGGNVTQGQPARFNTSSGKWVATAPGANVLAIPGAEFDTTGVLDDIVAVRLRRPVPTV